MKQDQPCLPLDATSLYLHLLSLAGCIVIAAMIRKDIGHQMPHGRKQLIHERSYSKNFYPENKRNKLIVEEKKRNDGEMKTNNKSSSYGRNDDEHRDNIVYTQKTINKYLTFCLI